MKLFHFDQKFKVTQEIDIIVLLIRKVLHNDLYGLFGSFSYNDRRPRSHPINQERSFINAHSQYKKENIEFHKKIILDEEEHLL